MVAADAAVIAADVVTADADMPLYALNCSLAPDMKCICVH